MKICSKCKKELSEDNFCNDKSRKDGLHPQCKTCIHESAIARSNKNKIIPPLKICGNCKIQYNSNEFSKDKYSKDGLNWWCKYCSHEHKIKNPKKCWAYNTLSSHKNKGILINVNPIELYKYVKHIDSCQICNTLLNWERKYKKSTLKSPTLDRINNENFINKDNIMIICHECNTTKGTRLWKDFINYCHEINEKFYREE